MAAVRSTSWGHARVHLRLQAHGGGLHIFLEENIVDYRFMPETVSLAVRVVPASHCSAAVSPSPRIPNMLRLYAFTRSTSGTSSGCNKASVHHRAFRTSRPASAVVSKEKPDLGPSQVGGFLFFFLHVLPAPLIVCVSSFIFRAVLSRKSTPSLITPMMQW